MSHSAQFSENPLAIDLRNNIRAVLEIEEYQASPYEVKIPDIPVNVIIERIGEYKHRQFADAFDREFRSLSRRMEAQHWELGGMLFWWDYVKLWYALGYNSFKSWTVDSDWLPYRHSQLAKLRYTYECYIYRLNIPEHKPELLQPLLECGNIDKPSRIATYMVADNVDEWIPILAETSRDKLNEYAGSMQVMADNGIEARDMTPNTVELSTQIIGGLTSKTIDAVRLNALTLDDFYGQMNPNAIIRARFEGDAFKQLIALQDLNDPRLKRNRMKANPDAPDE